MSKYAVILFQEGGGCDYTIGCGVRVDLLNANTLEEARVEARQTLGYINKYGDFEGDLITDDNYKHEWKLKLEQALLVEVHEDLPIEEWSSKLIQKLEQKVRKKQEDKERAEFERLRKKYE